MKEWQSREMQMGKHLSFKNNNQDKIIFKLNHRNKKRAVRQFYISPHGGAILHSVF